MPTVFYNTSDRDDGTIHTPSTSKYARYLSGTGIVYPKIGEWPLITDVTWLIERAKQGGNGAKFHAVFCTGQHPGGRSKAEFNAMLFSQWWCNKHMATSIEMYKRSFWHTEKRWAQIDPKYPCYGLALYHCALPYEPDSSNKVYQPSRYDLGCYENYLKKVSKRQQAVIGEHDPDYITPEQLEADAGY